MFAFFGQYTLVYMQGFLKIPKFRVKIEVRKQKKSFFLFFFLIFFTEITPILTKTNKYLATRSFLANCWQNWLRN